MAKAAPKKITKTAKASPKPAAAKAKKAVKAVAPVKKAAPVKAPVVSKDQLRAQLEQAQTTIAKLRAKAREATRAAKSSAAQIAELEAKVAQLGKETVAKPVKQRRRKVAEPVDAEVTAETQDPDATQAEAPEGD